MYLDIIILVVLILAILDGLKNGLFVEFLSVFGLVINFIAARYFTPILIQFLNLKSNDTNYFIVYIVMFWAVYIVIGLILHFLKNIMEGLTKGFVLRILGGIIGAAKGAVLALVVIFIFNFTSEVSIYLPLSIIFCFSDSSVINSINSPSLSFVDFLDYL